MRRDVSAETSTAPWSTSSVPDRPSPCRHSRSEPPRAAPPGNGRRRTRGRDPRPAPPRPAVRARRPGAVPASPRPPAAPLRQTPAPSRNSRSAAASSARWTTAPTSGVRRPRITTIPSSSTQVESCRCRCRDSSCAAATSSTRRQARTRRSTWAAVPACAKSSSAASLSGVATRVSARTLAYEIAPRCMVALMRGSVARAWATRTFSRAAPKAMPVRQCSQCAQDAKPLFHPVRCVELAQQHQQLVGGGMESCRQRGDLLAERVGRGGRWTHQGGRGRSRRVRHREWRWSYRILASQYLPRQIDAQSDERVAIHLRRWSAARSRAPRAPRSQEARATMAGADFSRVTPENLSSENRGPGARGWR